MKTIILTVFILSSTLTFSRPITQKNLNQSEIFKNINEGEYYNKQNNSLSPSQEQAKAQGLKEAFDSMQKNDPKRKIYVIVNGQSISPIVEFKVLQGGIIMIGVKHGSKITQQSISAAEIEKLGQW
jgi:hypothetical protein